MSTTDMTAPEAAPAAPEVPPEVAPEVPPEAAPAAATAPAPEVPPEVAAARKALSLIPAEWRNDALDASVLQRAGAQALVRAVGVRAAAAHVRRDVAAQAVLKAADGDLSGVDEMIAAQAAWDAAERVRAQLQVPEIDRDGLAAALAIADRALTASDATIRLPALAYEAEVAAWRQACTARRYTFSPPLPTDMDRAAAKRAAPLARSAEEHFETHRRWRQHAAEQNTNMLALLAGAAGHLEQRAQLAAHIKDVATLIGQANAQRKQAGLNWTLEAAG